MKQTDLDNTHRQTPFTTPEGYFEDLPSRIQQRIMATPSVRSEPKFFPQWAYYALGAVAVLAVSVWLTLNSSLSSDLVAPTATQPAEQLLAEVSNEVLIDYLEESDIDVMATVPLTEAEQQELLEQELSTYQISEEYFNETNDDYIEEFL